MKTLILLLLMVVLGVVVLQKLHEQRQQYAELEARITAFEERINALEGKSNSAVAPAQPGVAQPAARNTHRGAQPSGAWMWDRNQRNSTLDPPVEQP